MTIRLGARGALSAHAPLCVHVQALVWADGEAVERDRVLRLLRCKAELQRALAALLDVRARLKAKVRVHSRVCALCVCVCALGVCMRACVYAACMLLWRVCLLNRS